MFSREKLIQQTKLITRNSQRVKRRNYIVFKNSCLLFFLLMALMFIITFFSSELRTGRTVYLTSSLFGLVLYLFAIFVINKKGLPSLPFHYLLYTVTLWMAGEDAIFLNGGEGSAVAFCGMILVFSILTIDYSYRINGYIIILTAVFIWCAFCGEPRRYGVRDMANAFIFCILSIIIGHVARTSTLSDFESERILHIERNIDTLTGIPNRRSLFEALAVCEKPSCGKPYSGAIMIDIDNFKNYNDTYGHQAGDKVLKQIGCFLRDYGVDFSFDVFRYGGEEFLVMTKDKDRESLKKLADNIVATVSDLKIPYRVSVLKIVTISAGYAFNAGTTFSAGNGFSEQKDQRQYESLIRQADSALYAAKKAGKNRAAEYEKNTQESEIPITLRSGR